MLSACHTTWQANSVEASYLKLESGNTAQDSALVALIQPYKDSMEKVMGDSLGTLPYRLVKEKPNGLLGMWTADLFRAGVSNRSGETVDIAVLNNGGIRRPYIGPGKVTRGEMYELMPFENRVMLLQLDSAQVMQLAAFLAKKGGDPVSGLQIKQDSVLVVKADGKALSNRKYTLCCTDYQYNGGDDYDFLQSFLVKQSDMGLLRDILIESLNKGWCAAPPFEERRYQLD